MAAPKKTTIQQRFGFMDKDLKKPEHDEIMFWLTDNIQQHFEYLAGYERKWREHEFHRGDESSEAQWIGIEELPEKPRPKVFRINWEPVITTGGKGRTVVGFPDLLVMAYVYTSISYNPKEEKFSEYFSPMSYYFEAKTEIPSLGELIRQLRMYQEYTPREARWFVVAPECQRVDILEAQGFKFIKYDPELFLSDEVIGPDGEKIQIPWDKKAQNAK